MNSKQRVINTFKRKPIDRVPMWFGSSPEFIDKAMKELNISNEELLRECFHDDFRRVYSIDTRKDQSTTPFGIVRKGFSWGIAVNHPLENAGIDDIMKYPFPKADMMDERKIGDQVRKWNGEYAILGGEWSPFFHDAIDLMGIENFMIAMYEDPELVHLLLEKICDFYINVSKKTFESYADIIDISFIGNDFGSQTGPLIGKNLFDEFLAPCLEKLCKLAHHYEIYTMLHCCGSFAPLIPSMIICGVDSLQALQPISEDMQISSLQKNFGDKIILNGGVNSVSTLIEGTTADTKLETEYILKTMKVHKGYILSASHDFILEETPVENIKQMFDTGFEFEY